MSITSTGLSDSKFGTASSTSIAYESGAALESSTSVAKRLDRSRRTVERYVQLGILPPPIKIRGKNFFIRGVMPKPDAPDTA
jgi:transposase